MSATRPPLTRRELARLAGRSLALGALALGSTLLLMRSRRQGGCPPRGRCSACSWRPGCEIADAREKGPSGPGK